MYLHKIHVCIYTQCQVEKKFVCIIKLVWFIFLIFFFYWSIVALQCCISFCCKQHESAVHTPPIHIGDMGFRYIYISLYIPVQGYMPIHISPLSFGVPSHLAHHRPMNRVLCALQQVLICYPFYTQHQSCNYVHAKVAIYPILPFPPLLGVHLFFCVSMTQFLLCTKVHLCNLSRFHIKMKLQDT